MSIIKKEAPARVNAYIIGFVSSVATTLIAYALVVNRVWPTGVLIIVIAALAVVQLAIQLIFFLHLGEEKGPRWKLVTFSFALIVVGILVVGSLWIMDNLNYNMMHFTPAQQDQYLKDNEGI
jgi:cytochrome o ubiquinol oxidase subunit IV